MSDILRRAWRNPRSFGLASLGRVFHGLVGIELDIVELAINPLNASDVDVLDDVARGWIDCDRPARAFPRRAFHGREQSIAVSAPAGPSQRIVNQMHAVVGADR